MSMSDQTDNLKYLHFNQHKLMILKQLGLVKGLRYYQNFISAEEKQKITSIINNNKWCCHLRRNQQYYGIKYFQTKVQDVVLQSKQSHDHQPLHAFQFLIDKTIHQYNIFQQNNPPNQVLVNKYMKYDRLGLHVQDIQAFGDIIVGISLGSTDFLRLVNKDNRSQEYLLQLEDKSCYVLSGDSRFQWKHGIGRSINKVKYKNEDFERISLTVRHVIQTRRKLDSLSKSKIQINKSMS